MSLESPPSIWLRFAATHPPPAIPASPNWEAGLLTLPIVGIRISFIETILTVFYFPILNGQFQELVGSDKRFKILL